MRRNSLFLLALIGMFSLTFTAQAQNKPIIEEGLASEEYFTLNCGGEEVYLRLYGTYKKIIFEDENTNTLRKITTYKLTTESIGNNNGEYWTSKKTKTINVDLNHRIETTNWILRSPDNKIFRMKMRLVEIGGEVVIEMESYDCDLPQPN